ncbi:MAG: tetratricopeptide repeat protein [Ignavibacteriaceae bacterium]
MKRILLLKSFLMLSSGFFFFGNQQSYPQPSADTVIKLNKQLTEAVNGSDSIYALSRLIWEISWSNPDMTYNYALQALEKIGSEKDEEQLAELYDAAALSFWVKGDLKKARLYYMKALNIGIKNNIETRIAWESFNLADLSLRENKFKEAYKHAARSRKIFERLNKPQMLIQCDLLLNRARNDSTKTVQNLLASDSVGYELSIAKTAEDSAAILCWVIWSLNKPDPDVVFQYGLKVLELSKRITNEEKLAEVYDAAALAYRYNVDYKGSAELYKKALEIGEKHNLPNRVAWGSYNLASLAMEEKKFQDILLYAVKSREAFWVLKNSEMIISNDWLLINANHSNYIDTAITDIKYIISQTEDPDRLLKYYFNIIYLFGKKENKTQSMIYAMKALEIAEEMNNQKAILSVYYQIGDYLRDYQHNYEIALLYYNKILEITTVNKDQAGIAWALNEIGNVQKLLGQDSLAFAYFNRSLEIAEKINHNYTKSSVYKNIGEMYYLQKDYEEALAYFLKSYNTGCDDCSPVFFHIVLIDLGKVYLDIKDYENALKYISESLSLADSVNAVYEKAVSYSALADIQMSLNNSGKAIKYYRTSYNHALEASSLSLRKEISLKLSKAYYGKGDYANSYKYLALSKVVSDSLNKISEAENLSRIETKFEFQNLRAQKENDKLKADAELRKQTMLKYFFIVAFVLTTILGLVIFLSFRRKKRDSLLLEQQKKQIEEMSARVHEADQKKLNFFTNISHEFRTPLTLILGPVEKLVRENNLSSNSKLILSVIHRNALQLYNLINQVLDIRKLDTGNIKLKVSYSDIQNHCRIIYSIFYHLAEENNITYNFNSTSVKALCWFDHDILEKILNNLLSNAFKFTTAGGEINVAVEPVLDYDKEISYVKIIIKDNGQGIPEDQIKYIFDRYYQVENTDSGYNKGTGIGLAYTKELIELHKGKINVDSKLNKGTTFTIILPVQETYYSENEKLLSGISLDQTASGEFIRLYPSPLPGETGSAVNAGGNVPDIFNDNDAGGNIILVVEDNDDLREYIKSIFSGQYKVYEASEGETGYRLANELIPDVIISDIMMPGMNGLELCSKLKNNIRTNHIPVLILTAKTGEENEITGLKKGADDYLTKPFNSQILEMRINRLIEQREILRKYFTREYLLNPNPVKTISPDDEFLKKAIKSVENNITNPDLNVEMLMNELGVSRTQLFRKLKATTGYSANHFIRNIRLKRAAQILSQNSCNITEALYMSGFNSPSYFSSCFREMYGCLPSEYKSSAQSA